MQNTHQPIEPAILYLGTPVVLVSTLNEDGSANLSPMSSAWWLGWSCMLGFDASSKTVQNLERTTECVLNLPSSDLAAKINALARLTGSDPMPAHKAALGYRSERDKFRAAGLTEEPSTLVSPPRVAECPIQLEAILADTRPFADNDPRMLIPVIAMQVRVVKVHADRSVLSDTFQDRIDPHKWRPLIMSFLEFFDRGENLHPSRLGEIPQESFGGRRPQRIDVTKPGQDSTVLANHST